MSEIKAISGHLRMVPSNIDVFLQRLSLWGKSTSYQGLLESKKKNVGNRAFSEIIKQP